MLRLTRRELEKGMLGSNLIRLSENAKSEKLSMSIKGLTTRKSGKMPILGQPVIY